MEEQPKDKPKPGEAGRRAVAERLAKMTAQERTDYLKQRAKGAHEARQRRELIEAAKLTGIPVDEAAMLRAKSTKAHQAIHQQLATMAANEKHTPTLEALVVARELLLRGASLDELRRTHFTAVPEKVWNNFKTILFKATVASPEDMGSEILASKARTIDALKGQIVHMEKQQRLYPKMYAKELMDAYKSIHSLEMDTAKNLVAIGAIGTKSRGGVAIQIINNIPRPSITETSAERKKEFVSSLEPAVTVEISSDGD